MTQNSTSATEEIDLEALMNTGPDENSVVRSSSPLSDSSIVLKPGSNALAATNSPVVVTNQSIVQNGTRRVERDVIDLTRPVKTEGEASSSGGSGLVSAPEQHHHQSSGGGEGTGAGGFSLAKLPLQQQQQLPPRTANSSVVTPPSDVGGVVGSPTMGGLGPHMMTALASQFNLSKEEQAAAYRKANVLALKTLAEKAGSNAKDILTIMSKLQEFLTNLISLAENSSGPNMKVTVQLLVQRLVVCFLFNNSYMPPIFSPCTIK